MRKLTVLFFMMAVFVLPACCISHKSLEPKVVIDKPLTNQELAAVASDAVVALVALDSESTINAYCGGTWVSQDLILTVKHCVDDVGKPDDVPAEKWDSTGALLMYSTKDDVDNRRKPRLGEIIALHPTLDLALIRAIPTMIPPLHGVASFYHGEIRQGDPIHVVGHPNSFWWTYINGTVSAIRTGREQTVVHVSSPLWNGNSGSALFNSDGKVIGICSYISKEVPLAGFAVTAENAQKFITSVTAKTNVIDVTTK